MPAVEEYDKAGGRSELPEALNRMADAAEKGKEATRG